MGGSFLRCGNKDTRLNAPTTGNPFSDALSSVLESPQLSNWSVVQMRLAAPWGVRFRGGSVRFYFLARGKCLVEIDGVDAATNLKVGDVVVLSEDRGHCLRDSPRSPTTPIEQFLPTGKPRMGQRMELAGGGGRRTELVCGSLPIDKQQFGTLLTLLPPFTRLGESDNKTSSWLGATLRFLTRECRLDQPGSQAITDRLAQVMLILAIRSHLSIPSWGGNGELTALLDPDIGPIVGLMHAQPELPWSVAGFAERVCLSRSVFAERFKAALSKSPMEYLFECRMQKASVLLAESRRGIKEIATRVGYATEAAFSSAFKRWSGTAPGAFRREALGKINPGCCVPGGLGCDFRRGDAAE